MRDYEIPYYKYLVFLFSVFMLYLFDIYKKLKGQRDEPGKVV